MSIEIYANVECPYCPDNYKERGVGVDRYHLTLEGDIASDGSRCSTAMVTCKVCCGSFILSLQIQTMASVLEIVGERERVEASRKEQDSSSTAGRVRG